VLRNSREHPRSNLVTIEKSEYEIGPIGSRLKGRQLLDASFAAKMASDHS
jgi:hypothetical protein